MELVPGLEFNDFEHKEMLHILKIKARSAPEQESFSENKDIILKTRSK